MSAARISSRRVAKRLSSKVRKRVGIQKGGRVKATVVEGKLIIEPIASVEDLIRRRPLVSTRAEKAEELSEEAQKEEGAFG